MKIVNKGRGQGKTWDLIKEASENNGIIICANKQNVSNIENKMYQMWKEGVIGYRPDVVHVDMIRGMKLEGRKKYIDEIDYFIASTLGFKPDYAAMKGEVEDSAKTTSVGKLGINVKAEIDSSEMDELLDKYHSKLKEIDDITDKINNKKVSIGFDIK